jgi:hypothetical protein
MYIVAIGWLYVAMMMGVAEATNTTGTVMGGIISFVLYGLAPVSLVVYLMGSPLRNRAVKARDAAEWAAQNAPINPPVDSPSNPPDAGGETPADPQITPVRKEL